MEVTVDDLLLRIGHLRKWQEDNGYSDSWYITVDGVVRNDPMRLANVELFLKSGSSAILVLHADQAGNSNPQWIELLNKDEADFLKKIKLRSREEAIKRSEDPKELEKQEKKRRLVRAAKRRKPTLSEGEQMFLVLACMLLFAVIAVFYGYNVYKEAKSIGEKLVGETLADETLADNPPNTVDTSPSRSNIPKDQIISIKKVTSGGDWGYVGNKRFRTMKKTRYEVTYIDEDGIQRTVTQSSDPTK